MNIGTLCQRHLVVVQSQQPLHQAALLMREHHVGAVVVVDDGPDEGGQRVTGIVTDRDLAIEVLARGGDAAQARCGSVASGPVVAVAQDAGVEQAIALMQTHGVRRLLVHDADGLLVGVLSFDDLLPACVAPLAGLADVLRQGQQRESARRGAIAAAQRPAVRVPAVGTAGWPMP